MPTAVVGAGISGLALAYALKRKSEDIRLFEASSEPGGTIRTHVSNGFLTEAGPNTFYGREPRMGSLLEALGLSPQVISAEPVVRNRFIFWRGALRELPRSPFQLLRWKAFSLAGRLRFLAEPFIPRGTGEDESVASFARRRVGGELGEILGDAVQTGIFAGDPERLSLRSCFPALAQMEVDHRSLFWAQLRRRPSSRGTLCTFKGGLQKLPQALAQELGPSLLLDAPVVRLEKSARGYCVVYQKNGVEQVFDAKHLVLAIPAYAAAPLLRPMDETLADELAAIEYSPIAAVHLGVPTAGLPSPAQGFGALVPEREKRKVMGIIYASSAFPWKAPQGHTLFTCMVGGLRHPEHLQLDDGGLISLASGELREMLGLRQAPVFSRVDRWPLAVPQYQLGHAAKMTRLKARLQRHPGLHLLGSAYGGVGLHDCLHWAMALAEALG